MNQLITSYSSYHQENNLETSSTSKEQRPHLGPSPSLGAGANGCAEGDGIHLHLEQMDGQRFSATAMEFEREELLHVFTPSF